MTNTHTKRLHLLSEMEKRRVKIKLTKYKIFKATGHSQQNISRTLKGENNPSLDTVIDILTELGGELSIKWKK